MIHKMPLSLILAAAILFGFAPETRAEVVRFHYSAAACTGHTSLRVAADGAKGQWRPWAFSFRRGSWYCEPKATHMVTFRHPATGQNVAVPIAFPEGTPRINHQPAAIDFLYTLYAIRVEFLPDGSVDVVYNSGLLRPAF